MSPSRILVTTLALVAGLSLAGCLHRPPKAHRPSGPLVSGTVVYITNVQLPPDATILVRLVQLTRDGAAVRTVAEQTLPRPKKVPVPFDLPYRKRDVTKRAYYGVEAKILSGGRVLFDVPQPVPVLTQGNPSRTEIVVEPVK